ncbi:hypothetical protein A4A49_44470 [Nicotiana attenuata]|uniref:F-boxkelch-repeat protein n=1 Tax=Nicotiana attenuata TaxID=49451 RepID=A0A1J6JGW5_NICAT|nr:hypothetical protein A4A49_44470 [Nicotiana attenuata]
MYFLLLLKESKAGGGWALVDGHIYWAGGITKSLLERVGYSMKLYRHNIRSAQPEFWECVSHSKELQQYEPCALALGRTIYFLGGTKFPDMGDNYEGRHCGEAYNIDTKSWKLLALNVQDFAPIFSRKTTAVMKEENDVTVVCCSFRAGNLLFYKLNLDGFKVEVHPNFNFSNSLPN